MAPGRERGFANVRDPDRGPVPRGYQSSWADRSQGERDVNSSDVSLSPAASVAWRHEHLGAGRLAGAEPRQLGRAGPGPRRQRVLRRARVHRRRRSAARLRTRRSRRHAGQDLLHLQCHIGLDTLSWARRGAIVTGLDFSQSALDVAASVAEQIGAKSARFVASDVYDAATALAPQTFDIVYTGIGSLAYLPDIDRWAQAVAALVAPGGFLYLAEFHPIISFIEDNGRTLVGDSGWSSRTSTTGRFSGIFRS